MVLKTKIQFLLITLVTCLGMLATTREAQATCIETPSTLEDVQPTYVRYLQQLRSSTTFPWGNVQPYAEISGERITLTPEFEQLTGPQKQQVIDLLRLSTRYSELVTPDEAAAIRARNNGFIPPGVPPYGIYASDGRAVSVPYNACERFTLLTEAARYSFYYNRSPADDATRDALRNAGQPSWRRVNFPISPAQEKAVRLKFWRTVGYNNSNGVDWIAWVPEHGYFEINVKSEVGERYQNTLRKFWRVAPRQYRYVVVDSAGTRLEEKTVSPHEHTSSLNRVFMFTL
jgi:hypothetical protein